jgi:anhydro-N-acetylmuramic acid kinase
MKTYTALGLMSGSSLDGLDIACCEFFYERGKWSFQIHQSGTFAYGEEWLLLLKQLPEQSKGEIEWANIEYGELTASLVNNFIEKYNLKPDLIASHGHTILHEPAKGYTLQIGDGQTIAGKTKIKTICDFRSKDVSLGGQGAPLVPIGDKHLFSDFDFCLNIGGIANISFEEAGKMKAFDICGANQLLNHLSLQAGKPYDENGSMAQMGKMDRGLFNLLNSDIYFEKTLPKSLSNKYVHDEFIELLDGYKCPLQDKLFTVVKHIAFQVTKAIERFPTGEMLISGGGAHNGFLVNALRRETKHKVVIPDKKLIDFKEAMIFAFMGVLRNLEMTNCLASVTGAREDSSGGLVYLP